MATLSDLYAHLKTLCEQWFYNKSTMDSYLGDKISKSNTAGLVKNDGSIDTNTYLTSESLSGYEQTTNKTSSWNSTTNNTRYPTEKLVKDSLDLKANSSSLSTVATSGSYNDLTDKPTIPSDVSDLTDTQNTTFTPKSHSHGNLSNDGKIGTTANKPIITTTNGALTTGSFGTTANTFCQGNDSRLSDARTPTAHSHNSDDIDVDSGDFSNIASLLGISTSNFTNQDKANYYIDEAFAQVSSIKALEVVSTLPTASASTMGMLYIINENSKINFYYTEDKGAEASPRYVWKKMDTDILDELVVNWSDVQNKPSTFTPASHTHGNINNDGTIVANTLSETGGSYPLVRASSDHKLYMGEVNGTYVIDGTAHSNIGSSANANQRSINSSIDTALGTKITKSNSATGLLRDDGTVDTTTYLSSLPSHNHGNILNGGTCTTDVTFNSKILVTNSSNAIGTSTAIDVLDSVVQSLITYGSS